MTCMWHEREHAGGSELAILLDKFGKRVRATAASPAKVNITAKG